MSHCVLIVGAGSIGERQLRCFQATGRAEIVLVEQQPERCRDVAARYGIRRAFTELDQAFTQHLDAAVIATPAPLHVWQATELAKRGVQLLIEKPLSTNLHGVEALQDLVAARRLTAAVAYVYRCHPALAAMREAILQGRFGRPLELIAVAGQHFPTYRPAYRNIYYADRASGGGAIQDALTHLVNAGEWLVGPITRLAVDAAQLALEGVTVEDTVHMLARHGSVLASFALNQHQTPNETAITVVCDRGTARCELHENRWRWLTEVSGPWRDEPGEALDRDTIFIAQAHAFLDAVEGKRPVPCSLAEGVQTLRVNLAALASMDEGNWQSLL